VHGSIPTSTIYRDAWMAKDSAERDFRALAVPHFCEGRPKSLPGFVRRCPNVAGAPSMIPVPHSTSDTRILIVDDDLEIRQLLARYLSEQGFQITTAESGSGMNQALASRAHDLVVLDVMLQDASGLDLCRTLRSQSTT